jgi:tripartite-type tricarboxylate transporter receptor subunit TctC
MFVVPWPPGGGADMMARLIGVAIGEKLGTSVVVENRPGAAGIVGTELAARAAPDGHTLLLGSTGPNSISASLYSDLPYDPVADFTPITQITSLPLLLNIHAELPFETVQDLIDYAKENPGELNYGSVGEGTAQHLASEIFKITADLDMVHVPYDGSTPAFAALASGEVHMLFDNIMASQAMIDAGRVRPLGISSLTRSPAKPDVPTIDEAALDGFDVVAFQSILVPAGTPPEVVDKLHEVIVDFLNTEEMQERARNLGAIIVGNTPEEEKQRIIRAVEQWGLAVEAAGISLEY